MTFLTLYTFIQTGLRPGTPAGDLSIINRLGFAIVLVFIGLLILMFSHYYRMIGSRDDDGGKKKRKGYDPVSQLEYMSREDLKAMILREKAEREKAEAEAVDAVSDVKIPAVREKVEKDLLVDLVDESNESSDADPDRAEATSGHDLILKLILEPEIGEEESKKDEAEMKQDEMETKKPVHKEHKHIDKVERSLLSNESLEDFKRRSREI